MTAFVIPASSTLSETARNHNLVRSAFYSVYFIVSFLLAGDFIAAPMTIPMFVAVLWSLRFCEPDRVGQIDMVALVYFLFFCIVPLQQVDSRIFEYGELARRFRYPYGDFALVHALAIVSFVSIVLAIARSQYAPVREYATTPLLKIVALALSLAAFVVNIYVQGGIENVLAPRYEKESVIIGQMAPAFLAVQSVSTFLYIAGVRRSMTPWDLAAIVILLSMLAVLANPLNVARYALIGVWGPIVFLVLPWLLRPLVFYASSFFTLVLVVPLLSLTTRLGLVDARQASAELSYGTLFTLKNLNVFELSLEAVAYVERSGLRWGDTFLSTVFAHVPRTWWQEKPAASNLEVGQNLVSFFRYTNENLAVPWFMDGYMDFWIFGSVLFSALAALVLWWLNRSVRYSVDGVDMYSVFFLAGFLILARGTLAVVFTLFLFQIFLMIFYRRSGLLDEVTDHFDAERKAMPDAR